MLFFLPASSTFRQVAAKLVVWRLMEEQGAGQTSLG